MSFIETLLWASGGALTGLLAWSSIKCALNRGGNELHRQADYLYGSVGLASGLLLGYNEAPFLGAMALVLGGSFLLDSTSKISDGLPKGVGVQEDYGPAHPLNPANPASPLNLSPLGPLGPSDPANISSAVKTEATKGLAPPSVEQVIGMRCLARELKK